MGIGRVEFYLEARQTQKTELSKTLVSNFPATTQSLEVLGLGKFKKTF